MVYDAHSISLVPRLFWNHTCTTSMFTFQSVGVWEPGYHYKVWFQNDHRNGAQIIALFPNHISTVRNELVQQ